MTKQKLEEYRLNLKELKRFTEEYRMMRDLGVAIDTLAPKYSQKTKEELEAEKINLCKKVSKYLKEKREIEKKIENVHDASEALLLRYRYIDGYGWEEISELMNYSPRNIHYMHKKALLSVAN
ncbi:MAG: DUF1492 domain-containing protein [Clostridia bacterium]|nr:DUF1492 domain-containing protein [Clostridia bacterium]